MNIQLNIIPPIKPLVLNIQPIITNIKPLELNIISHLPVINEPIVLNIRRQIIGEPTTTRRYKCAHLMQKNGKRNSIRIDPKTGEETWVSYKDLLTGESCKKTCPFDCKYVTVNQKSGETLRFCSKIHYNSYINLIERQNREELYGRNFEHLPLFTSDQEKKYVLESSYQLVSNIKDTEELFEYLSIATEVPLNCDTIQKDTTSVNIDDKSDNMSITNSYLQVDDKSNNMSVSNSDSNYEQADNMSVSSSDNQSASNDMIKIGPGFIQDGYLPFKTQEQLDLEELLLKAELKATLESKIEKLTARAKERALMTYSQTKAEEMKNTESKKRKAETTSFNKQTNSCRSKCLIVANFIATRELEGRFVSDQQILDALRSIP